MKYYSLDLLFLIETENPDDVVRDVAAQLGYDSVKCVSPLGIGGGLALMWKNYVSVCCFSLDERLLDCKISNKEGSFYLSCIYGHPIRKLRHVLWEHLQHIATNRVGPWLMANHCNVSDLPYIGNNMTWLAKRKKISIESWLDRAMTNDEWRATYPASEVEYLQMIESDHRAAIIKIRKYMAHGRKVFRFERRLCKIPGFSKVVKDGWNPINFNNSCVLDRIQNCRKIIGDWKRENNLNSAKQICGLMSKIDEAQTDGSMTLEQIYVLRKELILAYQNEETYWHDKSRNQWLQEGDRNTRFFHASTKTRYARNWILSIQGHNAEEIDRNRNIAERYFTDLFSSSGDHDISNVLDVIPTMFTSGMNYSLTPEEIRQALFTIGPSKAP